MAIVPSVCVEETRQGYRQRAEAASPYHTGCLGKCDTSGLLHCIFKCYLREEVKKHGEVSWHETLD